MTSPDPDPNRPGAAQRPREAATSTGSRPGPVRDKDDVSSAPESGDKPDAAPDDAGGTANAARTDRPRQADRGRPGPVRDKDDVSSAPESGDKPDAAQR